MVEVARCQAFARQVESGVRTCTQSENMTMQSMVMPSVPWACTHVLPGSRITMSGIGSGVPVSKPGKVTEAPWTTPVGGAKMSFDAHLPMKPYSVPLTV